MWVFFFYCESNNDCDQVMQCIWRQQFNRNYSNRKEKCNKQKIECFDDEYTEFFFKRETGFIKTSNS